MARVVIQGDVQDRVVDAAWKVSVSTRTDRRGRSRARWLAADLYGREGGGYVLVTVNYSNVWHLPDGAGHVRKPQWVPAAELGAEAVYCGVMPVRPDRGHCPVYWADGGDRVTDPFRRRAVKMPDEVVTELPQRKITACDDYAALIEQVSTFHKRGATSVTISEPMEQLLDLAGAYDEVLAERPPVPL